MQSFSDIAKKYVWALNVLTGKLNFIMDKSLRGGGRGGVSPPGLEKFQGKVCFQDKCYLLKNRE